MTSKITFLKLKLMLNLMINFGVIQFFFTVIEAKPKSFGGKYAHDGQFPYVALLSYHGSKFCGASIFHERWAITAAHCLHDEKEKPLLTVGTTGDLGSGESYEIEKLYGHPNYTLLPEGVNKDLEYVVNDIGLIRLKSNIIFNDKVQPIVLATYEGNPYENSTATLVGWGSEAYYKPMHDHLRYINVRILSTHECRKVWTYADKHVCTSTQEHQGSCYGDSGSPLVVDGSQIGLLSTVDTFCQSVKPDLFTNIATFIPWIKNILHQHEDELLVS